MKSKILIGAVLLLVAIQFIPLTKNINQGATSIFVAAHPMDATTAETWKVACADCHSNNTIYPWYTAVQPVGFWINNHVNEGKQKFNIDAIHEKPIKKIDHKLEEMIEMLNENEMPLWSYTLIHKNAKLSTEQKNGLINWAKAARASMAVE